MLSEITDTEQYFIISFTCGSTEEKHIKSIAIQDKALGSRVGRYSSNMQISRCLGKESLQLVKSNMRTVDWCHVGCGRAGDLSSLALSRMWITGE